jgi:uracil-DNA glycosylase
MGLCFSVRDGVPPPPSLQNIFTEVSYEKAVDSSGDLTHWARQGVLLLNSVLTVEAGKAGSHATLGKEKNAAGMVAGGWEQFTDAVIQKISQEKEGVVFLLWGNYARSKKHLIDTSKHLVLEAPHPSPLSAHGGFFGCGHFVKVNDWLRARGEKEIEW